MFEKLFPDESFLYDDGQYGASIKVLFVTHFFQSHGGGIENAVNQLTTKMIGSRSISITWAASDCDPTPPTSPRLRYLPVPSWNVIENRFGLPYPIWAPTCLYKLWKTVRDCDVVHIHDYIYMGSIIVWCMAKILGRPVVLTQHARYLPLANKFIDAAVGVANRVVGQAMLRWSDVSVFVSELTRTHFFPASRSLSFVIPNGVDVEIYSPKNEKERSILRAKLGLANNQPVVIYAGRFVAKKGFPFAIELSRRMKDVQWLFAGRGPLDPGISVQSNIYIFRDRQSASLAELYQAADILVLPSVSEGLPLVVQESLACGTPVLCSSEIAQALPGLDEILFTEDVMRTGDFERWEQRLRSLLSDIEGLSRRRSSLSDYAKANWSWSNCAFSYHQIYLAAADGK